jgi:hypothetical protein
MPHWQDRPATTDRPTMLEILRAKPAKSIGGIVLSHAIVGAYTHYWKGKTKICETPNCEPCNAAHKPRWYGYLAILSPTTHRQALLELTPACLDAIDRYLENHSTLRNATLYVQRAKPKINARIICEIRDRPEAAELLPQPADVKAHLARIWEIDLTHDETTRTLKMA